MKKIIINCIVISSVLVQIASVDSEELLSYKGINASISNDYQCQSAANVRLDAKDEDQYRQSRIDMQALSDMVKTYLWLDCNNIESVNFEGYVTDQDKVVYQAKASKKANWHLSLKKADEEISKSKDPKTSTKEPVKEEAIIKEEEKLVSQDTLEREVDKGSDEATIELAKGLLDLESANDKIEFKKDEVRGLKLLESLALKGNLDAKHVLGEAYRARPTLPVNTSLLEKIMNSVSSANSQSRSLLAANMTMESARSGGKAAIKALKNAGKAGSSRSFYALAAMYLMNGQNNMPLDAKFLEGELEIKTEGRRGKSSSSVDVGLHFMKLAAEKGNANAQKMLKEMEIEYDSSSSQNPINAQKANSSSASQLAKGIDELNEQNMDGALQEKTSSGNATAQNSGNAGGARSSSGQGQASGVGVAQSGRQKSNGSKSVSKNTNLPKGHEGGGKQITEEKEEEIID